MHSGAELPAALLRAYHATSYAAGAIVTHIGRRSPQLEQLLTGRPGGFITASNPHSRKTPEGRNARLNRALAQHVRALPHWPGAGVGRGWREAHLLVQADPRRLLVLARRFRQTAILLIVPPRPAQLRLSWPPPRAPRVSHPG